FQENQLALQSVGAGNDLQQQLFGNALTSRSAGIQDALTNASLAANARATGLGEQQGIRANQLQELAALLGGSYNPTPGASFTPGGQIDVAGPIMQAYNGQLANWQNQQQQQAGMLQGLASLGTMAMFL